MTTFNPAQHVDTGQPLAHTLTVFNAVDLPEAVAAQVMALLAPYDPDIYTRGCDRNGRTQ
jgi:hypothetical protein